MLGLTTTDNASELSDEEILIRSQTQPWLFRVLVDRYEAAFIRKARTIVFNPLDVEEIVQDAFTKIYVNTNKFNPQEGAKFSSWAYRILLNTAFTRYQKVIKQGQRVARIDPEFEQFIGEQANHSGFEQKRDGIDRILDQLPGHFAYVLRLHYLERWTHQQIATETVENVGTIKARIHRAKAAFKKASRGKEADLLS